MKTLKRTLIIVLALTMVITGLAGCAASTQSTKSADSEVISLVEEKNTTVKTADVENCQCTILVDVSASTKNLSSELSAYADYKATELEAEGFDVARFNFSEKNGKDTDVFAAISSVDDCKKFVIVTDGWQDPSGDKWESLKTARYAFKDITLCCVKKTEHTDELVDALKNHPESFSGCDVLVEYQDGSDAELIYDQYPNRIGVVRYTDENTEYYLGMADTENADAEKNRNHFPWWLLPIILLALLLLGLLLWWLLSRRKKKEEEPKPDPEPQPAERVPSRHKAEDPIEPIEPEPEPAERVISRHKAEDPAPEPEPQPKQHSSCCCCCRCCCCCMMQHSRNTAAIVAAIAAVAAAVAAVAVALVALL